MKTTKNYIDISQLIYKEKSDLLSETEARSLQKWKGESAENLDIYTRLSQELNVESKIEAYNAIDSDKAWCNLETELKTETKTIKLFKEFMRYAAVLLLPLAIGGYLVFNAIDNTETNDEILVDNIVPGTQKASLVLANGEVINLENQKDSLIMINDGSQLSNINNILSYTDSQLADADIKWHRLVVPKNGYYMLKLSDGTIVHLNSDSELKYTDKFIGKERIVYLKGEAYFDVAEDKKHAFIVKTESMDVKVYGTEFNVMAYDDEDIVYTTLVEGSVGLELNNETGLVEKAMLEPNMQMAYVKGSSGGQIKIVDTDLYIGWKDGLFQFNDETLGSILRKLSRWYDVKVFFQNPTIENIRFTGEMKRFEEFRTILNLLELGSDVEFDITGNVLVVNQK
ncbi:FecR family protein [Ancylomarina sp. 16SWW S1-10-2]|uniref:FecR family protein n=1 Tax=Ancylomarina sp. 16SWW S1-10-2 TaxID=2499681 RepID=UPI0012AD551D|nr:FecR domain-containing protein [Ancylomarina sp. 16SWW S1-10-2]MRT94727.1 FecR family protein [Ancylomarina sp. 16SWW S1-10-2]